MNRDDAYACVAPPTAQHQTINAPDDVPSPLFDRAFPRLNLQSLLRTPEPDKELIMISKNVALAFAVVIALVCLAEARDDGPHDMADALRMLQELDRYYTQAARPRIDRRDAGEEDRVDPDLLDRAVRLLQLQNLDRIYSYHTRPRFGKRSGSDAFSNWAKDLEKPDLPAWLAYARRR